MDSEHGALLNSIAVRTECASRGGACKLLIEQQQQPAARAVKQSPKIFG